MSPLYTEPNSANVVAGPTVLYLAPKDTAPPSLASQPTTATWAAAGYQALGFTEAGVDFISTPAVKDIIPDEVLSPVLQIIQSVKVDIKAVLMEASIESLSKAVGMTVLTNPGLGIKTLGLGSGNPLTIWRLGFQGAAPGGQAARVIIAWRVQVVSAITQTYLRKDIAKLACSFSALSDSSQATTEDVYKIVDFGAGS